MRVTVDKKEDSLYFSADSFPSGTLIESRQGNQYLTMLGDERQTVLISLKNNRVYGTKGVEGAGKSLSYRKVPFSRIVLEGE